MNIAIDFTRYIGALKPLNGMNNGPINFDGMQDNRNRFFEFGVPRMTSILYLKSELALIVKY